MKINLQDGQAIEYDGDGVLKEILVETDKQLLQTYIGARLDGERIDFHTRVSAGAEVELIPWESKEAAWIYRHSMSHVLAQAVRRIFPDVKLAIGPAIEEGFYYDFDVETPFTEEDLKSIEKEMKRVVKQNHKFERLDVSREEAGPLLADEPYKQEIVEDLGEDEDLSFYRDGDFVDLCRGPHMLGTGRGRYFKLLSVAGAYWRGDENNKMLQRIYGTAFATREALDGHMAMLAEAKKRDHRRLGQDLDLFSISESIGPGLVLWHPKGARVRNEIENFWRGSHYEKGYELVGSPHVGRSALWETSGHLEFYSEGMYAPMEIDGQAYYAKPMNCPFHSMIYKSRLRSYRELPFRWAELGTVYRYERSGALYGLLRVRGFTQDDAHIFCRPDQMEDEIIRVIDFTVFILRAFGFEDFEFFVATRPPKFVGEEEDWERATDALKLAVETQKLPYQMDLGGGAFYGPKIDVKIKDALGREWQCSTIQFDFNLPERFDLSFVGQDGSQHRPYMVHRTLLGSMERFFGTLIEHYAGAFPVWLAPVQAVALPITENHHDYAGEVCRRIRATGLRVEMFDDNTLNYRIRQAQLQKIPYMLVMGDRELAADQVAIRLRTGENLEPQSVDAAIQMIQDKVDSRAEI